MKRKIISIITIIVICLSMNLYAFATSITDLNNKKDEAANNIKEAKDQLEGVKDQKSETLAAIDDLTAQIAESQEELDKLNAEVKELETSIKQTEKELSEAQERQNKQQEALEKRVVAQYKSGSISYWDILLSPGSPLEFISNLHMFNKIAKYDNDLIDTIEQEKQTIEEKKEKLDTEKAKVKTAKANAEKENVKLKNARVIKNSKVAQLSEEEKAIQSKIDEFQKEMDAAEAEIKRIAAASSGNSEANFNGELKWPCPNYTRITSYFGNRESPGGGVGSRNHKGIDLGAPHGASILAAESGTVITVSNTCRHDYPKTASTKCSCGGGYGNYVMVDHGGGMVTLYAHCATINVSKGQKVSKGQQIAGVGCTGYSTGNHLHFGVLLRGTYVNPLPYIT